MITELEYKKAKLIVELYELENENKFKPVIGQKLVVKQRSGHSFDVGETVEVIEIDVPLFKCKSTTRKLEQWLNDEDVEQ